MSLFDFSGLFATYSVPFTRVTHSGGYRDYTKGGQWVEGAPAVPVEMTGIVLPLSNEDLRFDDGGTYQRGDQKIYVRNPQTLSRNDFVIVRGIKYRVMDKKEYHPAYADFNIYIIRRADIEGSGTG